MATALKIMPMGDSLTEGTVDGGYRQTLYKLLTADGYTFTFVGDQDTNQGALPSAQTMHEGIGGDTSVQIKTQIDTSGIVQATQPNAVLLLVGTNDLGTGATPAATDANIAALIDDIIAKDPTVHIFLSTLLHRADDTSGMITDFNATLPAIVAARSANVSLVDMSSAVTLADLDPGGLHPVQAGYDKMAAVWESAIKSFYGAAATTPSLISRTIAGVPTATTPGSTIRPFATTTLGDTTAPYNGKVTATIKLTDGGVATDADGTLSGAGLTKVAGAAGVYTIAGADYATVIANELRNLVFTPTPVAAGQTRTTSFELDVTGPTAALTGTDTNTSVLQYGPASTPIIAGTLGGQSVAAGNGIQPLASVTITDGSPVPQDSVTITLLNAGGAATDANGTLSGPGLTETAPGSGTYKLAAADPATITARLHGLTFVPAALPAGQASVTTQFKLDVTDAALTVSDAKISVVQGPAATLPTANFIIANQTTGEITPAGGEAYTGPVAGISQDIILVTTDNINVTSKVANAFIHTGSGTDAIDVTQVNGNNILDGGTGSNFLSGGSGLDTFFLDNRGPIGDLWSTVNNFHKGDVATVWGVTTKDFTLSWADGQGAVGYTGLTLHADATARPSASLTLTGYTQADLSNGRLAISFNTEPSSNSPYMYIQAVG